MSDLIDDGASSQEGIVSDALLGLECQTLSARGTEDGLTLRINGKAEWDDVIAEVDTFFGGRKKFFEGGIVSIEWLDRLPTKDQGQTLETKLSEEYGLTVVTRRKKPSRLSVTAKKPEADKKGVTVPLFDPSSESKSLELDTSLASQIELSIDEPESGSREKVNKIGQRYVDEVAKLLGEELVYDDDANAKIHFGTLRSGQRVETPFSLVVVGDVNPGADLVAGGDIIVLGNLRGTAHAAAYDDDSFSHVIVAMGMQPMQLRIGSVISRGNGETSKFPEIARIDNRRIVVEEFNARKVGVLRNR